jgi:protein disulfide-isomerase
MKHLVALFVAVLTLGQAIAAEATWLTDLTQAQTQAKAENKLILANFTGSDWCPFCVKLDKEVFQTKEYKDFAASKYVLVTVDFPRKKALADDIKKANTSLKAKYKVGGFPTLVVMDSAGTKLGEEVGYGGGGPKAVIAKLEKIAAK